jgi:hypothetical protein
MHEPMKRTAAIAALVAAIGGAAAGCSGAKHRDPSAPAPVSTSLGLPPGVVGDTAVPTVVPNTAKLRKNVTLSSCGAADKGWQASGTATGDTTAAYTITVFFTTGGGTVIGTGQTKVNVKSGSKTDWKVNGVFHAAPDTRCVVRGVG